MRYCVALAGLLAALLLPGCAATSGSPSAAPPIPIWLQRSTSKPKRMAKMPLSLGLMFPHVRNYRCGGGYQPAARVKLTATTPPSEIAMPFWQLTVQCIDPDLKFDLPKGTMRAGMVWIFEVPTHSTSLPKAIQNLHPVSDLRSSSIGALPIGVGRIDFGGYEDGLVWILGGKTTWMGAGRRESGTVLVYLTGRAVPVRVLKDFAKSLRPLSEGG